MMNRRYIALFSGVMALSVALYLGIKSKPPTENPQQTTALTDDSQKENRPSTKGTSSQGKPRQTLKNRSSGIAPEHAEAEISRLLQDEKIPIRQASQKLLAMAADPKIRKEMREESLTHALNLVSDEDYEELVMPYLRDNLFEEPTMQRVALDEAYNRDDFAKLPAALAIFSHSQDEVRLDAQELMAFMLNRDAEELGENLDAWQQAIDEHIEKLRSEQLEE